MSKRKAPASDGAQDSGRLRNEDAAHESSDEDTDMADTLDIDFEWFDPAEVDFHGLKLLLRQLFDADHEHFDLSGLSNLVISQPTLGSTVKVSNDDEVDIQETDPYAFLTVLNLHTHATNPAIKTLTTYLSQKATTVPSLSSLPSLLSPPTPNTQVGLILSERFINMPPQIVPPMYAMLLEEMQLARDEGEPYNFTHYLIISKTYTEIASKLPSTTTDDSAPAQKKSKKAAAKDKTGETFFFHAEDEVLHKFAVGYGDYEYTKAWEQGASDAKRAFQEAGVRPLGHMMLIEAGRFEEAVKAVKDFVGAAE